MATKESVRKENLVSVHGIEYAKEQGFETAFFVGGRPEKMILSTPMGYQTADGEQVTTLDDIHIGIIQRAEDPFRNIKNPWAEKKKKVRVRWQR